MTNEQLSSPELPDTPDTPKILLLVGGKGTRLASVSKGISKGLVTIDKEGTVSGIEHAKRLFDNLSLADIALLAKNHAEQYEEFVSENSYEILYQEADSGTGGAVEDAIEEFGLDRQYLVMSADTYVSARDIDRLVSTHTPGTVTWGVSNPQPELLMDSYDGLVVDTANQILGDVSQVWWQDWDTTDLRLLTKGAVQIIDPQLYLRTSQLFKRLSDNPASADLYWDIMPLMEEQNRRRIQRGQPSIMNAVVFEDDLIDYGTPERLALTRERYNSESTKK